MISFPNAKINLGLHILSKRDDGFHNLETCFYPVHQLSDALECIESDTDSLTVYGNFLEANPQENLVWKAYALFRKHYPEATPKQWHLLKKIPSGGGLGGGSADAAFALNLMAACVSHPPTQLQLAEMAASLGSDCAFFLKNRPQIGLGRGEILEDIDLDINEFELRFIFPDVAVSTARAFSQVVPAQPAKPLRQVLAQPVSTWKLDLVNDFEPTIFTQFPELAAHKQALYDAGAVYAAMSGSGSTLFGLFER